MAGSGYDGSIKIDTSVDSSGMAEGVDKIGNSVRKMGSAVGASLVTGALGVATAVAAVVAGLAMLVNFGKEMWGTIKDMGIYQAQVQALQASFNNLKGALAAAFIPLITALTPFLVTVVNWLTEAVNKVAMFIGALNGQKTVMQYVTGSIEEAAAAQEELNKKTEKTKKSARGAMAAFDAINVLQQKAADVAGSEADIPAMKFQEVAIDPTVQSYADKVKEVEDQFDAFVQSVKDGTIWGQIWGVIVATAEQAWGSIKMIWGIVGAWFQLNVINPVSNWFKQAWEDIKKWFAEAWENIKATWNAAGPWFQANVTEPVKRWFSEAWENIKKAASDAWENVKTNWNNAGDWFSENVTKPAKSSFSELWENIKTNSNDAWENVKATVTGKWEEIIQKIQEIWNSVVSWLTDNISTPIQNAFGTALDWVEDKWRSIWGGITDFVKNSINTMIDFVNGMIEGIATGLNSVIGNLNSINIDIPEWVPGFGGNTFGLAIPYVDAPRIPRLATGAVVPAHSSMLAMVGEGSQQEIVAPSETIRQIVDEVVSARLANQQITIEFEGTMAQFVQALNPYIKAENRRIGGNLISGGAF